MQIAALTIITIILLGYYQHKRIGILSNKCFEAFLWIAFVNVASELCTLYTIWHIDEVGESINRLAHQFFIGSLDFMIMCVFFYGDIRSRRQKCYSEQELITRLIPALLALVFVLFGRLDYYMGDEVRYSHGPMAMTVYLSVAVYLIWLLRIVHDTEGVFQKREKWNMRAGVLTWMAMAVIQLICPETLLSSLATASMVLFLYISFEDPQSYVDKNIKDAMNEYAFETSLQYLLEQKHPFRILQITAVNAERVNRMQGESALQEELEKLSHRMMRHYRRKNIYHISDRSLAFFFDREKYYERFQGVLSTLQAEDQRTQGEHLKFSYQIIPIPELGQDIDEIRRVLLFSEKDVCEREEEGVLQLHASLLEKLYSQEALEKLVEKAVMQGELDVYYQPIYATGEQQFHSAEALVRLQDTETLGYISPEIFVPIIEHKGLADQLGEIVLCKVCEFIQREKIWQYGIKYIEVNLSALQMSDERLSQKLTDITERYGISPSFINLEITETATTELGEQAEDNMLKLKELGFQFSMDDFGTGYSNLSKMAESSFDLIKLDKSLIWSCFEKDGEKATVILEASILMIHRLGLQIVAEGVETVAQRTFLQERGVEYLQGYLFSRPISEDRFAEFLHVEYVRQELGGGKEA